MFTRLIAGAVTASMAVIGSAGLAGASSPVVPPSRASADIVSIAVADGRFTTLVAAVGCADPAVATALTSGEQLTVFAPTDAAFAGLGLDATNVCSTFDQATLTNVLLYHVTEGRRFSNSVLPKRDGQLRTISSLLGASFGVDRNGEITDVDSSSAPTIVIPNIAATNGVVHAIDDVLLPIEL